MPSSQAGSRIRLRRQQLDMSQADLAARVGVHESTVTAWESGKHFPRRHQGKLEVVLGLEMGSLARNGTPPDPREEQYRDLGRDRGGMLEPHEVEILIADYRRKRGRPPETRAG